MANAMQQANPDLVESLRRQFGGDGQGGGADPSGGNQGQQPPPGNG